jgi:hypothetical protein
MLWAMLLAAAVGCVAMFAVAAWASRGAPGGWAVRRGLASSLGYSQFRGFLAVGAVCVLLMASLTAWLIRNGLRRRMHAQAGTAIIEFALILPIILFIGMVLIQSSLLMGGFISVNYASYAAARSAIVMVPANTLPEPRNMVQDTIGIGASPKVNRVWVASLWPLLPTGDGGYAETGTGGETLNDGLDALLGAYGRQLPNWARDRLQRKLAYVQDHTQVQLAPPINGDIYGEHEDIRVEVRHDLYMSIPYAGRFFAAIDSSRGVSLGDGKYAVEVTVNSRLPNEGRQDYVDEETID